MRLKKAFFFNTLVIFNRCFPSLAFFERGGSQLSLFMLFFLKRAVTGKIE